MNGWIGLVAGLAGILTAIGALWRAKYQNKRDILEGTSVGEQSLATAVKVVEEIYSKVTTGMNVQIDELLADNKDLREQVSSLRKEVAALAARHDNCQTELVQVRQEIARLKAAQ